MSLVLANDNDHNLEDAMARTSQELNDAAATYENAREGESDGEEDYYENPLELIREFGTHGLMDRGQKAFIEQLKEINYRVTIDASEKKDELKALQQERETLGVQLYQLQQQLARIQTLLENAHNEYNGIIDMRLQEEEMLKEVTKSNKEQSALFEEYSKQHKKHSTELDALNETIRQIEIYNEQVKSEIAISRRAAYKVEQNMQELEKQKETQDFYVDNLGRQVRKLNEQIDFIARQFDMQKKDTNDAAAVLLETAKELDLISTEKTQLMLQWKAALSGLSRRDEALSQAMQTLAAAESAVHDYDVEIEASKREVQREQQRHETLVYLRDRMESELSWVDDNLNKIKQERAQLQERYTLLSKSLTQTDAESKKLDLVTKQLSGDSETVQQNLQVVTLERQKMEDELQMLYSTQSNVNKAVSNLGRDQMKLMKQIHDKENELVEIENNISRTTVDRLNLVTVTDQLKEQLDQAVKEMKEKEALAAKYQLEIRQRNDEIEKKMYRVDRLNKKYEKMVESAGGEENLGPMENTIKNLSKEIENMNTECSELEREWLRRQTEMVTLSAECEQLHEKSNEQQARVTVLTQQQLRLTKDLREVQSKLKAAKHINADYQKDVSKLNGLISENHQQETGLQAQNFVIEMDCVEELKEAERECLSLQSMISETRTAKSTLLDEIVEMERQAMLWEKKIQLDKETKQALDPTVGKAENEGMEREIHRMELRLDALKREQENLSKEMERAIKKRATIATRYTMGKAAPAAGAGTGSGSSKGAKDLTKATVKKRIGVLKQEARVLAEDITQCSGMYEQKKQQVEEITAELERQTAQYGEHEEDCHQLQSAINDLLYQKQLMQERIAYRQKYCARLRELSQQELDSNHSMAIQRKLLSSSQALDNVKEIIDELQSNFPHLKEVLERVLAMADPNIPELQVDILMLNE